MPCVRKRYCMWGNIGNIFFQFHVQVTPEEHLLVAVKVHPAGKVHPAEYEPSLKYARAAVKVKVHPVVKVHPLLTNMNRQ